MRALTAGDRGRPGPARILYQGPWLRGAARILCQPPWLRSVRQRRPLEERANQSNSGWLIVATELII
jgi:hypothetical protein